MAILSRLFKKKDGSANTQAQYIFDLADVLLSPLL